MMRTSYKHVWHRSALRMHGQDTTKCEMNARSQSTRKGHMAATTTIIGSMELTYENTISVPASQRRINKPVRPMYDAAWVGNLQTASITIYYECTNALARLAS